MVEDEAQAAETLSAHLERYSSETGEELQVIWFSNALDYEEDTRKFDLVFMDIEMPGINGMEAARQLRSYDEETLLIFVTNLAQYAVRGYEVDALDFIVKPVKYPDFKLRMDRAVRTLRRNKGRSIVAGTRDGMRVLALSDIESIEVRNHDLLYHLVGEGEPFVVYGTLSKVEQDVADGPFVRISKSCLVNMNHIRLVKGSAITMRSGEVLYLSRSKKKEALATIANFLGGSI